MKPHCESFEALLARAADATIEDADHARLDAHLSECDACRAALADQMAARQTLLARPALHAHPDFSARVLAAIEHETESSPLAWLDFRRWTWRLAPVAAALLIAAGAVLQLSPATGSSSTDGGGTFDATLPVSSALWQEDMTDASVLSLMLVARADDALADATGTTKER